jgi:hypothetical protein
MFQSRERVFRAAHVLVAGACVPGFWKNRM